MVARLCLKCVTVSELGPENCEVGGGWHRIDGVAGALDRWKGPLGTGESGGPKDAV